MSWMTKSGDCMKRGTPCAARKHFLACAMRCRDPSRLPNSFNLMNNSLKTRWRRESIVRVAIVRIEVHDATGK